MALPGASNQNRQIQVNPLDPEGKIAPYRDTAPPVIREIRFHRPVDSAWRTQHGSAVFSPGGASLDPSRLSGLVDVRARIEDLQSFRGWWRDVPLLETDIIRLASTSPSTGPLTGSESSTATSSRPACGPAPTALNAIRSPSPTTMRRARGKTSAPTPRSAWANRAAASWFRLFAGPRRKSPYWDTTAFRNGPFRLTVTAWDIVGNRAAESIDVIVANNV